MAERNPTAPQVVDPLERQINDTIDRLIGLLNVRRVELLNLVRDKRAADRLPQQMIDQLTETQEQLDKDLRQNMLQPLKKRIMRKLECKKRETILQTPVETLTEVKCDTHELETMISSLGEIVEVPVVSVPRYATFHSSELLLLDTHQIAVTWFKTELRYSLRRGSGSSISWRVVLSTWCSTVSKFSIHEDTHQIPWSFICCGNLRRLDMSRD